MNDREVYLALVAMADELDRMAEAAESFIGNAALVSSAQQLAGTAKAIETPIGHIPTPDAIDLSGLNVSAGVMKELLDVEPEAWQAEVEEHEAFFAQFGSRLPEELKKEVAELGKRLGASNGKVPAA